VLAELVDNADVRMIQRGHGASFAFKTFECAGVGRKFLRKELHRDPAAEFQVLRAVDYPHTSRAENL
jgi:hypothetical protein